MTPRDKSRAKAAELADALTHEDLEALLPVALHLVAAYAAARAADKGGLSDAGRAVLGCAPRLESHARVFHRTQALEARARDAIYFLTGSVELSRMEIPGDVDEAMSRVREAILAGRPML